MDVKKVLKTKDIIKVEPEESLASALNLLGSSHDSAFVFDKDTFMGIINPYYALIKKSYPSNTKARHAMMHPPKITFAHKVEHAVQMMVESKIHYLPVFEGKDFVGIVSARRVMKHILDQDMFDIPLARFTKDPQDLHVVGESEPLSKALSEFKNKKTSKLIVLDKSKKVSGVLTYYDIIQHMTTPRERQGFASKQGKKNPLLKKSVKNFSKSRVHTLTPEDTLRDATKLMLDKKIGSVIIVDKDTKPVGIVTTKDILVMFSKSPGPSLTRLHSKNLSKASQATAGAFTHSFNSFLQKVSGVTKADVTITEKKKGGVFEAVVSVFREGKPTRIFRGEDTDLRVMLQDIRGKAKRVLRKK